MSKKPLARLILIVVLLLGAVAAYGPLSQTGSTHARATEALSPIRATSEAYAATFVMLYSVEVKGV
jgi:hypothetical protein